MWTNFKLRCSRRVFSPTVLCRFRTFPCKTLRWRLYRAAARPRSVNLSLPHGQVFVGDSRSQGWHCRGRVVEGSRNGGEDGDREREGQAYTPSFSTVWEMKRGRRRQSGESDRGVERGSRGWTTHGEGVGFEHGGQCTGTSGKEEEG